VRLCRELPNTIIRRYDRIRQLSTRQPARAELAEGTIAAEAVPASADRGQSAYGGAGAMLHHVHGQVRLTQLGDEVGGHDLPPLAARITPHVTVRTIVILVARFSRAMDRGSGGGATSDVGGGKPH
jgi:hypothetical protein